MFQSFCGTLAVLHFSDATPMTQKDLEKELKKFMPQYNSGKNKRFDFAIMLNKGDEERAIRRAKALRKNNEKHPVIGKSALLLILMN